MFMLLCFFPFAYGQISYPGRLLRGVFIWAPFGPAYTVSRPFLQIQYIYSYRQTSCTSWTHVYRTLSTVFYTKGHLYIVQILPFLNLNWDFVLLPALGMPLNRKKKQKEEEWGRQCENYMNCRTKTGKNPRLLDLPLVSVKTLYRAVMCMVLYEHRIRDDRMEKPFKGRRYVYNLL